MNGLLKLPHSVHRAVKVSQMQIHGKQLRHSVNNSYCRHLGGIYLMQQCNAVNLRMLANCRAWNCTQVENKRLRTTLAQEFSLRSCSH